jgi:RNA polymerase sigma-70 factor (ECF subfamily)
MDLFEAAREGSEIAFLELFNQHHVPLFRFAYRLTGSEADAEDVVQECFLELLRPGCSYDSRRTSIRTFLFGVVRNQSLKRLRRREMQPEVGEQAGRGRSPEGEALHAEMEGEIARAVQQLPEAQRAVLILAHYEQIPLAEIATVMELELGAVKSRLQRARASLKEALARFAPGMERNR